MHEAKLITGCKGNKTILQKYTETERTKQKCLITGKKELEELEEGI